MTNAAATETATAPVAEKPITAGKAPVKKAAKKAASKKEAKKASTKKAASAKKSALKSESNGSGVVDPFGAFRQGTAKAAIANALHDGKYHSIEDLKKLCDEAGSGHGQVSFALAQLPDRAKVKIEYKDDSKAEVRVKK